MSSEKIAALLVNIEPVPPPPPKSKKKFIVTIPTKKFQTLDLIGELTDMTKSELTEIFGFKPSTDTGEIEKIAHEWLIAINGVIFCVRDWKGSWRQNNYMVDGPRDGGTFMTAMFGAFFKEKTRC